MKLQISDFVNTIEFINDGSLKYGWSILEYRQGIPGRKDGGTWASSPFLDGRTPVFSRLSNPIDTFELQYVGNNPDEVSLALDRLVTLLDKGVSYWTSPFAGSNSTVPTATTKIDNRITWLVAQSPCETNIRYAPIMDYIIPDLPNQFGQPFLQVDGSTILNITLTIERQLFQDIVIERPSSGTLADVPTAYTYHDATHFYYAPGPDFTISAFEYHNGTGIALGGGIQSYIGYIQRYDAAPPAYTNLGLVFPHTMWPAVPAAGDYYMIGSRYSMHAPFYLVCNALPGGAIGMDYWNGAAWIAIPAGAISFQNDGVNFYIVVNYLGEIAGLMGQGTFNGLTAYWIRYSWVAGANVTISGYNQMAFDHYFIDPVSGDYPALVKQYLRSYHFFRADVISPSRVMIGFHSSSRLKSYEFLNDVYATTPPAPGAARSKFIYTAHYSGGVVQYFLTEGISGGGRTYSNAIANDAYSRKISCSYNAVAARTGDISAYFEPLQLYGKYRLMVGVKASGVGAASLWEVALRDNATQGSMLQTDYIQVKIKDVVEVLDFGEVTWPPDLYGGDTSSGFTPNGLALYIKYAGDGANVNQLDFYWVRLIPVDEFFADCYTNNYETLYSIYADYLLYMGGTPNTLIFDSLVSRKRAFMSMFGMNLIGGQKYRDEATTSGPLLISSASGQQMASIDTYVAVSMLAMKYDPTTGAWVSAPSLVAWGNYVAAARYKGLRGNG